MLKFILYKWELLKMSLLCLGFYSVLVLLNALYLSKLEYYSPVVFIILFFYIAFPVFFGIYSYKKTKHLVGTTLIFFIGHFLYWLSNYFINRSYSSAVWDTKEALFSACGFSIIVLAVAFITRIFERRRYRELRNRKMDEE